NPDGVVVFHSRRAHRIRRNPVGVVLICSFTQGSSFLATLGFEPKSRWDFSDPKHGVHTASLPLFPPPSPFPKILCQDLDGNNACISKPSRPDAVRQPRATAFRD